MITLGKFDITKDNFSRSYLTALNGVMGLTPKELDVLSYMLDRYYEAKENGMKPDILETEARKVLVKETGIQNANLNRYLNIYFEKKLIFKLDDGTIAFDKSLFPDKRTTTTLQFSLFMKPDETLTV